MGTTILVAAILLLGVVFYHMSKSQRQLERQNRELLALHHAGLDIYGELSLDAVLQKVVDQARQLLDARYGAVAVYEQDGTIQQFVTSGISAEERQRIGNPPQGHGLLGVVLKEGQQIRVSEIASDPRSSGLPENHPPMRSLLAVPIVCKGPFRGNLYLAEKTTQVEFNAADQETLVRFATKSGIAIDNTCLHQRLRALAVSEERVRIAREMHDGLAQVLAYVNTKAQAVREYVRTDRKEEATEQLEQLAGAAREVYADVREGIFALRTQAGPDRTLAEALREFVKNWQDQSGVATKLTIEDELQLKTMEDLQLLRIIQEALSNVRKHSGAQHAAVAIDRENGKIVVSVRDDGAGFDPSEPPRGTHLPRFGLAIMRERAESIGGTLKVDSAPEKGTLVRVEIPHTTERT